MADSAIDRPMSNGGPGRWHRQCDNHNLSVQLAMVKNTREWALSGRTGLTYSAPVQFVCELREWR